jgi:hypothetical protein
LKYKDRFKLIAVVSHFLAKDGSYTDSQDICKSDSFTITDDNFPMRIELSQQFFDEIARGADSETFILLAVPPNVKPSDFKTLNEAIKLGGEIISKVSSFHPWTPIEFKDKP